MRIRKCLGKNLAVGASQALDVVLTPGKYILNRCTALGVTETFGATAIFDPGGADEELLFASDVPFDYRFQNIKTLAVEKIVRMRIESLDLAETRWSAVHFEYDTVE